MDHSDSLFLLYHYYHHHHSYSWPINQTKLHHHHLPRWKKNNQTNRPNPIDPHQAKPGYTMHNHHHHQNNNCFEIKWIEYMEWLLGQKKKKYIYMQPDDLWPRYITDWSADFWAYIQVWNQVCVCMNNTTPVKVIIIIRFVVYLLSLCSYLVRRVIMSCSLSS